MFRLDPAAPIRQSAPGEEKDEESFGIDRSYGLRLMQFRISRQHNHIGFSDSVKYFNVFRVGDPNHDVLFSKMAAINDEYIPLCTLDACSSPRDRQNIAAFGRLDSH